MPDSLISVTAADPGSTIVRAAADVAVAALNYAGKVRETASAEARDAQDRVAYQAYWDFRRALEAIRLVGDPMPWPPTK